MNNTTKLALAGLLSATGTFINALAAELSGQPTPEPAAPAEAPTKPKKTPKAEKPAEKPIEPEPEPETPAPTEAKEEGGKTYDELRELIQPLVKGGQGEDVKKVIAKYAPEGGLKVLATLPQHHAAFEKDLAALSY